MDDIRETFFQECEELLEELEEGLLELSNGSVDDERVNAMFRAVHSIKGGAGAFGLTDLVSLSHKFETVLDEVRSHTLSVTPELVAVFLRSADSLSDLLSSARSEEPTNEAQIQELVGELQAFVGEPAPAAQADDEGGGFASFAPVTLDFGGFDAEPSSDTFDIKFFARPEAFANGNEPGVLFRSLKELGELEIRCDLAQLPVLDDLEPLNGYFSWELSITTEEGRAAVDDVFEFAFDDCDMEITQRFNEGSEGVLVPSLPTSEPEQLELDDKREPILKVVSDAETKDEPGAATPPKPKEESAAPKKTATVRVDLDRVDRLINLVGELVINQAMLSENVTDAGLVKNSTVETGLDELKQLTRQIQESVMAIRAQPLKSLFQRMSRIVREAATATQKNVRLVTEGETTEVDKTVIERLADPLTHMIRNAVDHGLESTEGRIDAGKSEEGIVRLSAAHRSGRVVIEISDDGGGINRERVHQIAIEKQLVSPEAPMSGTEIDNLLFMPGFSTAEEVSDLSGRGVGMDVVKRSIQALGGRISIASTPKKGSTFSVSLPLTLAVLDGMIVKVAEQTLVIPLTSVVETLKPSSSEIHGFSGGGFVVQVRGHYVPVVDVACEMSYSNTPIEFDECVFLLIESDNGSRYALAVDRILDQRQVVIKGLKDTYGEIPGIAAATILGDGRIALILDADGLVSQATTVDHDLKAIG